ncbi:PGAM-domain-containing protein [Meredithblackwellia eburnea MCA 4105]
MSSPTASTSSKVVAPLLNGSNGTNGGKKRKLPRLIFIRHGQAFHNVQPEDKSLLDPFLTPLGVSQARTLSTSYPTLFSLLHSTPREKTLLVTSPFRRTLQTTLIGFAELLPGPGYTPPPPKTSGEGRNSADEQGVAPVYSAPPPPHSSSSHSPPQSHLGQGEPQINLQLLPQLQECGSSPCDTGSALPTTIAHFPPWLGEYFSTVWDEPDWNQNRGMFDPEEGKQRERARWVRRWLRERGEDVVVVVSHHGFLRRVCGLPTKVGVTQWDNCEAREYQFVDPTAEDDDAEVERVADVTIG